MSIKKPLAGVGNMDADYVVDRREYWIEGGKRKSRKIWTCPFYRRWADMISRCYNEKRLLDKSNYIGCSVCEEWLTFSKFRQWMQTQDWEGKHLDKDLLVRGNKVYSPDTCVFISGQVNSFLVERGADRGDCKIGVRFMARLGKFESTCSVSGKQRYIGLFDTELEAHKAWLAFKLEQAKILAAEQTDPRVAKALIERYENYVIEE